MSSRDCGNLSKIQLSQEFLAQVHTPQCWNINICMWNTELLHLSFPAKALPLYNPGSTLASGRNIASWKEQHLIFPLQFLKKYYPTLLWLWAWLVTSKSLRTLPQGAGVSAYPLADSLPLAFTSVCYHLPSFVPYLISNEQTFHSIPQKASISSLYPLKSY